MCTRNKYLQSVIYIFLLNFYTFLKMQDIVADTTNLPLFDIEIAIDQQIGAQLLPFPGMDSKFEQR